MFQLKDSKNIPLFFQLLLQEFDQGLKFVENLTSPEHYEFYLNLLHVLYNNEKLGDFLQALSQSYESWTGRQAVISN